jgi:hypothetical protein
MPRHATADARLAGAAGVLASSIAIIIAIIIG